MKQELVILVNEQDQELGLKEKISAHRDGDLHRALSVFLFDDAGRLLLQKRADTKYHSPGLWTNTCCSHPRPGEAVLDAAVRRLKEEMGIVAQPLQHAFSFSYRADVGNGLTEHELDHVFIGRTNTVPLPSPEEVSSYAFIALDELETDLELHPQKYTAWFRLIFSRIKALSGPAHMS